MMNRSKNFKYKRSRVHWWRLGSNRLRMLRRVLEPLRLYSRRGNKPPRCTYRKIRLALKNKFLVREVGRWPILPQRLLELREQVLGMDATPPLQVQNKYRQIKDQPWLCVIKKATSWIHPQAFRQNHESQFPISLEKRLWLLSNQS